MLAPLSTIAQLGIGLAGFSGIVVALGYRPQQLSSLDRVRVLALLFSSLGAALFATLPLILAASWSSPALIWRVSSLAFAAALLGFHAFTLSRPRTLSSADRAALHPAMWVLAVGGSLIFSLLLLWNAAGRGGEPSPGPYLWALYYQLVYSSVQFIRLLLVRPGYPPAA